MEHVPAQLRAEQGARERRGDGEPEGVRRLGDRRVLRAVAEPELQEEVHDQPEADHRHEERAEEQQPGREPAVLEQ